MRKRVVRLLLAGAVGLLTVLVLAPDPLFEARTPRSTTTTSSTTSTTTSTTRPPSTTTSTTTTSTTTSTTSTTVPVVSTTLASQVSVKCVVRLHGKGGDGFATFLSSSGWYEVGPRGNATGWGGYQWLYFPEASYAAAVDVVARAISGARCTKVVVDGFSNGAAFAAKLACRGATFGGTVVGYVIDDPVPDHGTDGCARTTQAVLYWTGGLSNAVAGWSCASADWTCEGGETVGIAATAAHLGLPVTPSVNTTHAPYANPPELARWLR